MYIIKCSVSIRVDYDYLYLVHIMFGETKAKSLIVWSTAAFSMFSWVCGYAKAYVSVSVVISVLYIQDD